MTETLSNPGNGLARQEQPQPPAKREGWSAGVGHRGIVLSSFSDLWKMAQAISASGLAPKNMARAETLFVALEMGLEVGLAPMAAIRSIAVINGRPAIFGDAALALVRASGLLESFEERIEGTGDGRRAICISKRKAMPAARVTTFSIADARAAQLLGKDGPWRQYPDRMLQFRARGFNLRDEFGDVLNGMVTVEEAQDIPIETAGTSNGPAEPQRGVAGLLQKITTRPVSEGQVFEPAPEAVAQAEAEQSDEPAAPAEPQEPDAGGVEAEPPGDSAPGDVDPTRSDWATFEHAAYLAAEEAKMDPEAFERKYGGWVKLNAPKGKVNAITPEKRAECLRQIRERSGTFA